MKKKGDKMKEINIIEVSRKKFEELKGRLPHAVTSKRKDGSRRLFWGRRVYVRRGEDGQ